MAREVVWTNEAAADLKALAEYIEKDSAFYSAAFVQEILDVSRSLDRFAERGRIVPELTSPDVRELLVREYRLIYSIDKARLVILGLIHGKRDLRRLWDKEKRSN